MERRLRILPFDNKPEKPDADLKTKLLKEAPGILRWLIEGCLAWQKIGLQPPDAVRIAGKDYFEGQDAFARWIEECCTLDEHLMTSPSMLRGNYNQWAKSNGEDEMGGNAFSEAIDQFTPPITNPPTAPLKRVKSDGNRLVRGIGINPSGNSTKHNFP
jgi:putative DNA primase/helicase